MWCKETNSSVPTLALSFDIECYYQIVYKDYLGRVVPPTREVLVNATWILDLLHRYGKRATLFFLGNVAEAYPELVRRAVQEGHEIGVHGDVHDYVRDMDQAAFRSEIERGMQKIRWAGAEHVIGHRATAFSITRDNLWALETLADLGIKYDSSVFPFDGPRYGIGDWPRHPGATDFGIAEVPLSVVTIGSLRLPCMGGGYVRYFPLAYTRWCANRLWREGLTPVCYFHPYEFSFNKPTMAIDGPSRIDLATAYRLRKFNLLQGIGRGQPMRRKIEKLVRDYNIVPVGTLAE